MAHPAKTKLRIGIVGCGNISMAYLRNAPLFRGVEITACADIKPDAAARRAAEFGIARDGRSTRSSPIPRSISC